MTKENDMDTKLFKALLLELTVVFLFLTTPAVNAQSAFIDVEHGRQILCGLLDDNSAICNAEFNVQARTPPDLPPVQDIAANENTVCAVLVGGNLRCWGQDGFGLLNAPTAGAPYKSISMGIAHACAINTNDEIECWGVTSNNRLIAPAGQYSQLSLASQQACALDFNGAIACWGSNDQGTTDVPAELPQAQKVVASFASSCALLLDGSINCWGRPIESLTGPYVDFDLFAGGTAENGRTSLCAIDPNGQIECRFFRYTGAENITTETSDRTLPVGTGNTDISLSGVYSGCYVNAEDEIACFGTDNPFVTIPSVTAAPSTPDTEGLRSQVYSATTVELFWDSPRDAFNVSGHEIQRNGDDIVFTQNLSSFLFDDLTEGETETFAVRRISIEGQPGAFSDTISVTTMIGPPDFGPNPTGYAPPPRPFNAAALSADTFCSDFAELYWAAGASNSPIDGYEIHRDGTFISFTSNLFYFDEQIVPGVTHNYDVIAIDVENPNQFFGVASAVLEIVEPEEEICN